MLPSLAPGNTIEQFPGSCSESTAYPTLNRLQASYILVLRTLPHIPAPTLVTKTTVWAVSVGPMEPKAKLSEVLRPAENLVRAPSDAASEVARAVSATERAICEELRLGRVSVASSGLGSQEEVDPDYQCPICLVSYPSPPANFLPQ